MAPSDSELRFDTGEAEAKAYSEPVPPPSEPQHHGTTIIELIELAEKAIAKRK